ncbi:MAG: hypothetical protein ACUVWO_04470 [Thermodesulfobacteriota bacterium]
MRRWAVALLLAVAIMLLLTTFGCPRAVVIKEEEPVYRPAPWEPGPPPWAPAHGRRAKHRYHYYPESYVYFDIGRKLYFFFSDNRWQASVSLPIGIRMDVSRYVVIEMDEGEPYRFHSEVVKRYPPGHLKKSDEDNGRGKGKGKGKEKWE